jgi:hypothetical protein
MKLFQLRHKATNPKHQLGYKKMINFIYGKWLSKPRRIRTIIYKTEPEFIEAYNHCRPIVKSSKQIDKGWRLVIDMRYNEDFNLCRYGVSVMSQARRLTNHLFDCCNGNSIKMYYIHTDSNMIQKQHLEKLQ